MSDPSSSSSSPANPNPSTSSFAPSGKSAGTSKKREPINTPLIFIQPFNILVFLTFFSPVILATIITATSFMNQNANGFIYLGYLLASVVLRNYVYYVNEGKKIEFPQDDEGICTSIQYSKYKYGNASFSAFVMSFTLMYLLLPMFSNNNPNYFILSILIVYFMIDITIKVYKNCIKKDGYTDLTMNILFGLSLGALIVTLMYAGGSGQYLFFDTSNSGSSSNNVQCSMPSKQTFKCSVYRNGELIDSTTTSS